MAPTKAWVALLALLLLANVPPGDASRPAPHLGGGGAAGAADDLGLPAALAAAAAQHLGLPASFAWASAPEWGPAADVALLNRTLTGGGFHRDLTYTLELRGGLVAVAGGGKQEGAAAAAAAAASAAAAAPRRGRLLWRMAGFDRTPPPASACSLTVVQPLPPGLFADPYQLEGTVRAAEARRSSSSNRKKRRRLAAEEAAAAAADDAPDAFRLLGPLDLELPAPACLPTALVVHKRLPVDAVSLSSSLRLRVPLHAKYPAAQLGVRAAPAAAARGATTAAPPASSSSPPPVWRSALAALGNPQARVPVPPPLLMLRCDGAPLDRVWRPPRILPPHQALSWPVPAGSALHLPLASWGTFWAAAAAAAAVVAAVWAEAPRLAG